MPAMPSKPNAMPGTKACGWAFSDFEEFKIYIVGGKPYLDEPHVGEWKSWHFRQYPLLARELWNLLARERVAAGSLAPLIASRSADPFIWTA